MKQFTSINFAAYSDDLNGQIAEVHSSRLSHTEKIAAFTELGLMREDLRVIYGGRYYTNTPFRITAPRGKTYTFGVEIECFVRRERVLAEMAGNGINAQYEGYNHRDGQEHFKFVTDASVSDNGDRTNAIECVSPILKGTKGHAALKKACKSLVDAGARVNRTCGLHVHIGCKDYTDEQVVNVYRNYQKLESLIDSFMAPSRRGDGNCYCRSIKHNDFASCLNNEDIKYMLLHDRYHKVNPMAFDRHRTIEFRQHQGTVNYTKIDNWVKFLIKLVDWSSDNALENEVTDINAVPFLNDTEKRYFAGRISEMNA